MRPPHGAVQLGRAGERLDRRIQLAAIKPGKYGTATSSCRHRFSSKAASAEDLYAGHGPECFVKGAACLRGGMLDGTHVCFATADVGLGWSGRARACGPGARAVGPWSSDRRRVSRSPEGRPRLRAGKHVPKHVPNSAILTCPNCTDRIQIARNYRKSPANGCFPVTVQSSGSLAGVPCWCSESLAGMDRRGGGGGLCLGACGVG
jgi:hypothetical protein